MNLIIVINIIGIILIATLLTAATVLLFLRPKQKPINHVIHYKDIIETETEFIFVEESGDEFHMKK